MTTIVNPKAYAKTYFGQIWYDLYGQIVAETGHELRAEADRRITSVADSVRGKWCFSLIKTMHEELGKAAVWDNAVVFPDGKHRKLKANELPVEPGKAAPKGVWLTTAQMKVVYPKTRIVQSLRFPFERSTLECRLTNFPNMLAFEKWAETLTTTLFVYDTKGSEQKSEEGLWAYLVVAPH